MFYIVDSSNKIIGKYPTQKGAKISNTRKKLNGTVMHSDSYVRKTKMVKNLITGADVEIDVNTPRCCDPSTDLYWSM